MNVVAESLKDALKVRLRERSFSLMVDESTDCSESKILAICIRYYAADEKKILTELLGRKLNINTYIHTFFYYYY